MNGDPVAPQIRDMAGPAALPRANGALVFEAPWQGRVFGVALAVVDDLGLDWDAFRDRLIAAIGEDPERAYYESWAIALERLVLDVGVIAPGEVDERVVHIP